MSSRSTLRVAAIAAAGVAVTACGGIRVSNTVPQHKFPPTCAEAVIVYESYSKVPNNYYEVALITAEGNSVWTGDDEMVLRMKQRAASVGANGMVVDAFGTSATTVQLIGAALGTGDADRKGRAVAIHMPTHVARARATCQRSGS
ncbi:MAG: hypothetical protein NUW01_20325 [Gemmatimonadaceae bacterium]|nr:hypothetical protein [Gemmatimonadaceae bacterium]